MFERIGKIGQLSEDITEEYLLWRIWMEKGTPLEELKYKWTYPDLLKANALLDMQADYDSIINMYYEEMRNKKN